MTENEKVIVKENAQTMKVEVPITIYLLIFLQMLLLAFIGFRCVELVDIGYTLVALNMGLI